MNKHPHGFAAFNGKDFLSASSAAGRSTEHSPRLSEDQLRRLSESVQSIPDGAQKQPYASVLVETISAVKLKK